MEAYITDFLVQCRDWQIKIKRDLSSLQNASGNALTDAPHLLFTVNRFKLATHLVQYTQLNQLLSALEQIINATEVETSTSGFPETSTTAITQLLDAIDIALIDLEANGTESVIDSSALLQQVSIATLTEASPEEEEEEETQPETVSPEVEDAASQARQADYIKEFLIESYDNLENLEKDLLQLEKTPDNNSLISGIFRMFHTIKGSSGIVGLSKTESIVHSGESLVGKLRDGKVQFSNEISDALFRVIDVLRTVFDTLDEHQVEGDLDYTDLVDELSRLQLPEFATAETKAETPTHTEATTKTATVDVPSAKPPVEPAVETTAPVKKASKKPATKKPKPSNDTASAQNTPDAPAPEKVSVKASTPNKPTTKPAQTKPQTTIPSPSTKTTVNQASTPASKKSPPANSLFENNKAKSTAPTQAPVSHESKENTHQDVTTEAVAGSSIAERSIRIDIGLLDSLMDQVGELVLTRNQIIQVSNSEDIQPLNAPAQALNLITSELQAMVMKTRMRAIRSIWDKFPRMVRDLAHTENKKILIEVEGADTELDRSMLEQIKDPLMHLVRNAIDHGIELPEDRIKNGKSAEGVLTLRAYNEAGKVDIEISDDGAGINYESIKQTALAKGLITREKANTMTEQEALELIFIAGLTTAQKVTNVSGRGVGMDVVKTNIEKIGGSISLETNLGYGTRFLIKIPLTLVIIPTLLISSQNERFAIAQANIVELVDLQDEDFLNSIEYIHDVPIYRLRGQILPLIFLGELLQTAEPNSAKNMTHFSIVVVHVGIRQYGLVVDEISDSQEIVIKPLSKQLQNIKCYSGATILGDGSVALVLDILGIIQMADIINSAADKAIKEQTKIEKTTSQAESDKNLNLHSLLLFEDLKNEKMALPFSKALRLEEFAIDQIETVGREDVVQYRGNIMPLIYLPRVKQERGGGFLQQLKTSWAAQDRNMVHIVVISHNNDEVGLVVSNILDVIEEEITLKDFSQQSDTLFTSVVQGHVVEILDVEAIANKHFPIAEDNQLESV